MQGAVVDAHTGGELARSPRRRRVTGLWAARDRPPSPRRPNGLRRGLLGLGLGLSTLLGCPMPGGGSGTTGSVRATNYPPASVYEIDPEFGGEWSGDVDGFSGTLLLGTLDERSYFGSFVTSDGALEYTLLLDHSFVVTEQGSEAPSNRCTFTWQDGLGSRGRGWLLINRDDTALTGSFGYASATEGLGSWSFVRVDM